MRHLILVLTAMMFAVSIPSATCEGVPECQPTLIFTGEAPMDRLGYSVAGAGDVDKDGFADVIVGAPLSDPGGTDAGRVYIYSGRDGHILWTLTGNLMHGGFGCSVSGAGDVDRDGLADVIVGEFPEPPWNIGTSGHAHVYSGATGSLMWTFHGDAPGDYFGSSVSGAGDVDNDGYDDLIVGACHLEAGGSGRAFVYSGRTGAVIWILQAETDFDIFGGSVSAAGDVEGDGFADVIVGARWYSAVQYRTGRAYVYSGRTGTLIHTFTGQPDDYLGSSVSEAGDLNGDGFADLIVGAYRGGHAAGRVYSYSGATGEIIWTVVGEGPGDHLGLEVAGVGDVDKDSHPDVAAAVFGIPHLYSGLTGLLLWEMPDPDAEFSTQISCAGDVNNDGSDEVIVGAYNHDAGGENAGRAYVYSLRDSDSDLVPDPCDNCPSFSNPDQIGCPNHGDVLSDGIFDVFDVVGLVDYAFSGGIQPPKDPPCPHVDRGDVNCDGIDDVFDIVGLIDFVFSSGPAPCNPCACSPYPTNCP